MGIVVDVAHGTFDLVKRAVATTTKADDPVAHRAQLTGRPLGHG
jgi:hypothetical protein